MRDKEKKDIEDIPTKADQDKQIEQFKADNASSLEKLMVQAATEEKALAQAYETLLKQHEEETAKLLATVQVEQTKATEKLR